MPLTFHQRTTRISGVFIAAGLSMLAPLACLLVVTRHWAVGLSLLAVLLFVWRLAWLRWVTRSRERSSKSVADDGSPSGSPSAVGGPTAPSVAEATHHHGLRHREGYMIFAREVTAFIPTGEWRNTLAKLGLGLFVVEVAFSTLELDVVDSPTFADDLADLVRLRSGVMLTPEWRWSRLHRITRPYVLMSCGKDLIAVDIAPSPLLARWAEIIPDGSRTIRVVVVVGGLAALCATAGTIGWLVGDNTDYLIAGLAWAGVLLFALIFALHLQRKARREP